MRITDTSDLWWKTAVIYCLDVETFLDWNDDGKGDFPGLAQRLDYLASLGITCLWLMPFYPTPDRDDGYDIVDFYGVDPRLGTLGDLVEVIRTARDRGMRVIADLVVNHTSDRHPWFKSARASRTSKYRDFYVWADQPPANAQAEPTFPDQETSVWTFDEQAGQYYLHRFYKHQPDLNVANPLVRDEIAKIMGYWLQLGLSGFRVDAVPFFLETMGMPDAQSALPDPHEYLRDLRAFLNRRTGDAILLGEVNLDHKQQLEFFGGTDGDELHMQFDFIGMQRLYLSLARGDAAPLIDALITRPQPQPESQWASFVRNHDELTLDKLSEAERQEVFAAFGPEPEMQVYGRGLIRRLPPMLGGDPRRIRMVYSLLFSLPGTPVLFYGEEIGMGENLEAGDRLAVRTPMQWSTEKNGGFSNATPSRLSGQLPEGPYGPAFVNVVDQQHDPDSLLNFIRTLAQCYRDCPELGWGTLEIIDQPYAAVLAHRCTWDDGSIVLLHNLAPEAVTVPLALSNWVEGTRLSDLLGPAAVEYDGRGRLEVALEGYGYRWIRVIAPDSRRLS
ncbi:MAG TPA: alpha-amylase family protein [Propionibacteriaceae bacterium]|nr:alpha-amylase family protein [Propionibacteriaceae bacterium]